MNGDHQEETMPQPPEEEGRRHKIVLAKANMQSPVIVSMFPQATATKGDDQFIN